MHELAIAQRMIETASALLPSDSSRVAKLRVRLGALAGLSEQELRFGFEVMSAETACAGATLEVACIPAIAHCPLCGIDFALEDTDLLICPSCNTLSVNVIQGKELHIISLEATDVPISAGLKRSVDESVGKVCDEVVHG